jgi:beta-N-acetylhexosaminidase
MRTRGAASLVTGLLRNQLGFDGVALTDDLDMGSVGYGFDWQRVTMQALRAGNDLLMIRNRENYDLNLPGAVASWISKALADGTSSVDALRTSLERVQRFRRSLNQIM